MDAKRADQATRHNVLGLLLVTELAAPLQDEQGNWNVFTGEYPWDSSAICCDNPEFGGTGNHKEGADFTAAPNLDHQNPRVKQASHQQTSKQHVLRPCQAVTKCKSRQACHGVVPC